MKPMMNICFLPTTHQFPDHTNRDLLRCRFPTDKPRLDTSSVALQPVLQNSQLDCSASATPKIRADARSQEREQGSRDRGRQ